MQGEEEEEGIDVTQRTSTMVEYFSRALLYAHNDNSSNFAAESRAVVSYEFDEPARFAAAFSRCYRELPSFGFAPRVLLLSHSPSPPPAWPKIRGLHEYVSDATNAWPPESKYDRSGSFWPTFKFSPSVGHGRSQLVMNNDQKKKLSNEWRAHRLWNERRERTGPGNITADFPIFFSSGSSSRVARHFSSSIY